MHCCAETREGTGLMISWPVGSPRRIMLKQVPSLQALASLLDWPVAASKSPVSVRVSIQHRNPPAWIRSAVTTRRFDPCAALDIFALYQSKAMFPSSKTPDERRSLSRVIPVVCASNAYYVLSGRVSLWASPINIWQVVPPCKGSSHLGWLP